MNSFSNCGVSLSGATSKTSRSMSTNTFDSREDLNQPKFNPDGSRNVKYIVNYKPKQSNVYLENITKKHEHFFLKNFF